MGVVQKSRSCKYCGCEVVDAYQSRPWSCRACSKAQAKAWRDANPEKCRAANKRKDPSVHYFSQAKRKYGVSRDDYQQRLDAQGGRCAICGTDEPGKSNGPHKRFSIDHDHKTGEVRGLLCNHCNRGIGLLRDDPDVLLKAHLYLKK